MRNMLDAYSKAHFSWAVTVSENALARTVSALDAMRTGTYSTAELTQDVYEYWRDLADYNAPLTLGAIPSASLEISSWDVGSSEQSNFVHAPLPVGSLALTPVVNPETGLRLGGLTLNYNRGENAVRVEWNVAAAGAFPMDPRDRVGLFQGGIFQIASPNTLVATVYARLYAPAPKKKVGPKVPKGGPKVPKGGPKVPKSGPKVPKGPPKKKKNIPQYKARKLPRRD